MTWCDVVFVHHIHVCFFRDGGLFPRLFSSVGTCESMAPPLHQPRRVPHGSGLGVCAAALLRGVRGGWGVHNRAGGCVERWWWWSEKRRFNLESGDADGVLFLPCLLRVTFPAILVIFFASYHILILSFFLVLIFLIFLIFVFFRVGGGRGGGCGKGWAGAFCAVA